MEQLSHHTRNSTALTSDLTVFVFALFAVFAVFISGSLFHSWLVPFENGKRRRHCSRLDVDIRPGDRSATAFWPVPAELLRRCGRERIKLEFGISGSAHRGTTLYQLWTNGIYASEFMTHSEVTNTQRWPEQQTPRPRHASEICPSHLTFDGNEADLAGFAARDNNRVRLGVARR